MMTFTQIMDLWTPVRSRDDLLVWRPVSIGVLNFEYACSPCILKGNNFFACSRTPTLKKKFVSGKAITLNMEKNNNFGQSSIIGEIFLALQGQNDLGNKLFVQ